MTVLDTLFSTIEIVALLASYIKFDLDDTDACLQNADQKCKCIMWIDFFDLEREWGLFLPLCRTGISTMTQFPKIVEIDSFPIRKITTWNCLQSIFHLQKVFAQSSMHTHESANLLDTRTSLSSFSILLCACIALWTQSLCCPLHPIAISPQHHSQSVPALR